MDRQVLQVQAQAASQERAQAHQKEMADFDAYMDNLRYQSAEAWEVEKMELRSRHDFEMIEAKREMDFQNQMQREIRQQQEMDTKLKAINEAEYLSPTEKEDAILKVQTGYAPKRTGVDFRKLEQDYQYYLDTTASYKRDVDVKPGFGKKMGVGVLSDKGKVLREASPAELRQLEYAERRLEETGSQLSPQISRGELQMKDQLKKMLPSLSPESQTSLRKIIDEGNPDKMRAALNRITRR